MTGKEFLKVSRYVPRSFAFTMQNAIIRRRKLESSLKARVNENTQCAMHNKVKKRSSLAKSFNCKGFLATFSSTEFVTKKHV